MARRLYLDTARLGLMRTGAQRLYQDFVRLAGEEGCTLYWEDFLRAGCSSWPDSLKRRYPALSAWQGVAGLKNSLRRIVGAGPDSQVLLANRSALLMQLAARLLFRPCRNVLVTDLTWPRYAEFLRHEQRRTENRLTVVRLRDRLIKNQMDCPELVDVLCDRFNRSGCDGLFLPAVDHQGIRLPVLDIIRAIRERTELRFAVVDGAQTLAHVPLSVTDYDCDFFIASCQKWLGAYHPLGLGFFGHPGSVDYIRQTVRSRLRRRLLDDPLLRFTEQLQSGGSSRYGETVNVAPMLTAQGALNDCETASLSNTLSGRIANADRLLSRVSGLGWKSLNPAPSLRSGILLLQASRRQASFSPTMLRSALHQRGIAATTYHDGLLRLSMPDAPWTGAELKHLTDALKSLG